MKKAKPTCLAKPAPLCLVCGTRERMPDGGFRCLDCWGVAAEFWHWRGTEGRAFKIVRR